MNYGWHDVLGNLGVLLILVSYLLLQLGRLPPDRLSFSAVNAIGALLILISLWQEFNLSAFLMEAFWLIISLYGAARFFARRSAMAKGRPDSPSL
jgi:hypothetical protein